MNRWTRGKVCRQLRQRPEPAAPQDPAAWPCLSANAARPSAVLRGSHTPTHPKLSPCRQHIQDLSDWVLEKQACCAEESRAAAGLWPCLLQWHLRSASSHLTGPDMLDSVLFPALRPDHSSKPFDWSVDWPAEESRAAASQGQGSTCPQACPHPPQAQAQRQCGGQRRGC